MTEYKLVVVGGRLIFFLKNNNKKKTFVPFVFFQFNSWRRGQKCIDNSTYPKSVSISKEIFFVIVLCFFFRLHLVLLMNTIQRLVKAKEYEKKTDDMFLLLFSFSRGFISKTSSCRW